ncbi:MAG: TetR family transcriptional regulator [Coriobacteriia bacterium]|nr:TetR family transcriptional regulator [Coriobacteriia bacterium]
MNERVFVVEPGFLVKLQILHAVDKPISSMSVGEICMKCGISRRTFYYHFENKFDIGYWYAGVCQRLYLDEIGRTLTCLEGLVKHFETLVSERKFYEYMATDYDERSHARERVAMQREHTILQTLSEYHGMPDPSPLLRFCIQSYASSESAHAKQWFSRGMDTPPETFGRMIEAIIPGELKRLLDDVPSKKAEVPPLVSG